MISLVIDVELKAVTVFHAKNNKFNFLRYTQRLVPNCYYEALVTDKIVLQWKISKVTSDS